LQKRILVVEDDENNLYVTTHILKNASYEILSADNGKDALEIAKKQKPDLILLDLALPYLDGYEVTKHLRALQEFRQVPIIAVTAYSMTGDREKIMKKGFTDYLAKPITPRDLVSKVEQYLAIESKK
jgi:two-component system, cell cycle response regulator DivK